MKKAKKLIKPVVILSALILLILIIANAVVIKKSKSFLYDKLSDVPKCYTAIVLGAKVDSNGFPSDYLQDRLDMAIELYRNNKITRFLLSGDHGQTSYDEVNSMKAYLIGHGINTENIFLDHAGFGTYSTMVRAKKIFQVKDAIIVTQEFHLSRAVFIARSKGLEAYGIKADKREYPAMKTLKIREVLAKVKAFTEVIINKKPKYLGGQIPITGDSNLSYD
jgi:SanA protein